MSKNKNLHEAKRAKNDEFYTMYKDIEKEVEHYKDELVGKWVYCPFDDYRFSNFVKYFKDNYTRLGLKHLTATNYDIGNGAYRYDYDGKEETITALEGNGSYDSEVCTDIRDMCDVIISNPPFSKFRSIIKWVVGKKFLLLGNTNAITFKEVFPLIKDRMLWIGCTFNTTLDFIVPNSDIKTATGSSVSWFTNMPHEAVYKPLQLTKRYSPDKYYKFDNYDAINVDKTIDIPIDYDGIIGVPITALKYLGSDGYLHFNIDDEYEIVKFRKGNDDSDLKYNGGGERLLHHTSESSPNAYRGDDKERRGQNQRKDNVREDNDTQEVRYELIECINRYAVIDNERTKKQGKYLSMVNGVYKYPRVIIQKTF